ncbi:MAG: TerB family tellurite resistance protein [Cyclobacteriaceae bacterium]
MQTRENEDCIDGFLALYYMMIMADGVISPKEVDMGNLMIKHEKINEEYFHQQMEIFRNMDKSKLMHMCIEKLAKCNKDDQIRAVAWMSNVANSDGFMDPQEWTLIYRIYNKELKLDLNKILEKQKELPRL